MRSNSLSALRLVTAAAALILTPTVFAQDGVVPEEAIDDAAETLERSVLEADSRLGENRISGTGSTYRSATASKYIVRPITTPNYSEDPYITTDVRGTYIHHQLPNNSTFDGGAARAYDFQGRYAVNEKLQVMVSKLGVVDVHNAGEEIGATDVALAVKYSLLSDWKTGTHAAIGAGYEFPLGDADTLGDDSEFRIFGTYGKNFDSLNFSASVNAIFATGSEDIAGDSDNLFVNLHVDYPLNEMLSPVLELNYFKTLSNGENVTRLSGLDLANFGGNEDEDVMTVGIGGELRVIKDVAMRLTYESPLTSNEDIFGYRWTASAVWTF